MRALLVTDTPTPEPYGLQVADMAAPELPDGGALVAMRAVALCGSDVEKLTSRRTQPGAVLGHEFVGEITALHPGYQGEFKTGDRIISAHHVPCETCRACTSGHEPMCAQFKATNFNPGGFAETVALSAGHLDKVAFKVPEGLTDAEASCVEPLACVLRGVDRLLAVAPHAKTVAVIGLGVIGLMAAWALKHRGLSVVGLEPNQRRAVLAQSPGWVDALDTAQKSVDAVFLSVVIPATVHSALEYVRDGGALLGFAGAKGVAGLDPAELYFRELTWTASYSPSLASLREAAGFIFDHRAMQPLVPHITPVPMADIETGLARYRAGELLKVLITP